jgi:hypothetical protein
MPQGSKPRRNETSTVGADSYRATLEERARRQKSAAAARELREWHARFPREAHQALREVFPRWVSSSAGNGLTRAREK